MGEKDRKIRALVSILLLADSSRTLKRNLLALPRKLSKKKCGLLLKPSQNLCQPPLHHGRGPKPFSLVIYPRFIRPLWFQPSKSSLSPVYISTGLIFHLRMEPGAMRTWVKGKDNASVAEEYFGNNFILPASIGILSEGARTGSPLQWQKSSCAGWTVRVDAQEMDKVTWQSGW